VPESDGSQSPFITPPARRRHAVPAASGASPFPEPSHDGDTLDPPARVGALTRRTLTAAGLSGVALLAACQTLPTPRLVRRSPTPAVTSPSTSTSLATTPTTATTTAATTTATTSVSTTPTATSTTAATTAATTTSTPATTTTTTAALPPPPLAALPVPELLARRATFGPTRALLDRINAMGVTAWLDEQLAAGSVADPSGDAVTAAWPDLQRPYAALVAAKPDAWRIPKQLQAHAVARAVWSSRQLLEVMAQFWDNHLHIAVYGDDDLMLTRPDFDRTVIRQHALGSFADMLAASAAHPAMMTYLNLAGSHKDNPNENYGREILELHTVGVDGGYTETDVKELAKLLTGWRMQRDRDNWTPFFEPGRHFVGPITVMGQTFANPTADGQGVLAEVTAHLARRPETAKYLAWKLVRHFVADEPPAALVDRLAATYLASDTAIVPVLRELFGSPEFAASTGGKVRRPFERFVATLRLFAPQVPGDIVKGAERLLDMLPAQKPYDWGTPDGFPDVAPLWLSAGTALDLFNVGTNFIWGRPAEAGVLGVKQLLVSNPTTFDAVASAAGQIALLREPTENERMSVIELLAASKLVEPLASGSDPQRQAAELAAALLLASPAHLMR